MSTSHGSVSISHDSPSQPFSQSNSSINLNDNIEGNISSPGISALVDSTGNEGDGEGKFNESQAEGEVEAAPSESSPSQLAFHQSPPLPPTTAQYTPQPAAASPPPTISGAGTPALLADAPATIGSGSPSTKNYSRTPTSWDAEDDILLMHLKDDQKLGWKEIASHFSNRTPNACQFRWRRLKSGNLKNPPKSASALGTPVGNYSKLSSPVTTTSTTTKRTKKPKAESSNNANATTTAAYSPISQATFTGYDNTITSALAGLNALSNNNPPSSISSPGLSQNITNNKYINTINHPQTFDKSPQSHSDGGITTGPTSAAAAAAAANAHNNNNHSGRSNSSTPLSGSLDLPPGATVPPGAGGGYYADISIDPTMNLPHNQPHPHAHHHHHGSMALTTPRHSISASSSSSNHNGHHITGTNTTASHNNHNHHRNSTGATGNNNNTSTITNAAGGLVNMHNNSIIQISRDDRHNSITSMTDPRASVSSLPSKSMNIPHHQSHNTALAHLPILFGGSISGPSAMGPSVSRRNSSFSGFAGRGSVGHLPFSNPSTSTSAAAAAAASLVAQASVPSLRNGSIVGRNSISGPTSALGTSAAAAASSATPNHHRNSAGGSPPAAVGERGYYSRSGSVVIPYNADRKDEDTFKYDSATQKLSAAADAVSSSSGKKKHKKKKSAKDGSNSNDKNSNNKSDELVIPWSMDEDELLINRRNRELSFAELSILLPQRTEGQIWSRIDYLEKLRNGHRASTSRDHRRRRKSSIGLDDVDDFYDDVDDMMGGIGVSDDDDDRDDDDEEDDDDDEVLVEGVDMGSYSRKRRRRRASSAVNPLSTKGSIKRSLR